MFSNGRKYKGKQYFKSSCKDCINEYNRNYKRKDCRKEYNRKYQQSEKYKDYLKNKRTKEYYKQRYNDYGKEHNKQYEKTEQYKKYQKDKIKSDWYYKRSLILKGFKKSDITSELIEVNKLIIKTKRLCKISRT